MYARMCTPLLVAFAVIQNGSKVLARSKHLCSDCTTNTRGSSRPRGLHAQCRPLPSHWARLGKTVSPPRPRAILRAYDTHVLGTKNMPLPRCRHEEISNPIS
ncbi:hypothetical protein F5X99DRAFT_117422 [Biscogniauxia marginata]|nr:hypothetical protein F5X99DRAFT_117422 [Biscogniauxia marginata]